MLTLIALLLAKGMLSGGTFDFENLFSLLLRVTFLRPSEFPTRFHLGAEPSSSSLLFFFAASLRSEAFTGFTGFVGIFARTSCKVSRRSWITVGPFHTVIWTLEGWESHEP